MKKVTLLNSAYYCLDRGVHYSYCPPASGQRITKGWLVLGKNYFDGNTSNGELSDAAKKGTLVHELGHTLNVGHSMVNGQYFLGDMDRGFSVFGAPPLGSVEVMFPIQIGGANTPQADDRATVSRLYPAGGAAAFATAKGTIKGTILQSDRTTPFQGANVIARNVLNRFFDAVSNVSGSHFGPAPAPLPTTWPGAYELPSLTVGENYTVEITNVRPEFRGGSSVGQTDPRPLPGTEEFYNGGNESEMNPPSNPSDDPSLYIAVQAQKDGGTSGIDVIINRNDCAVANELQNPSFELGFDALLDCWTAVGFGQGTSSLDGFTPTSGIGMAAIMISSQQRLPPLPDLLWRLRDWIYAHLEWCLPHSHLRLIQAQQVFVHSTRMYLPMLARRLRSNLKSLT